MVIGIGVHTRNERLSRGDYMSEGNFKNRIKCAVTDPNLQTALDRATTTWAKSRAAALEGLDFEDLRSSLRASKES